MEDGPQILPPPTLEPISRPSSTSTSASTTLPQLPGISSLTPNNGAATGSPQLRATNAPAPVAPPPTYSGTSPAVTAGGAGVNLPTCQNCSTSTTPLWRRDESGAVLCNACGLFLKLHGRPRPISLKTDVIKSRNRVKTAMRPDLAPKKKQQQQQAQNFPVGADPNSAEQNAAVAAAATRRASQKSLNGNHDGTDSPVSRTGTPSMYANSLTAHALPPFMVDDPYQSSTFGASGTADGRAGSPMNGDRNMDAPQTHEQLIAHNSSLKTRVSELEFINELFRGRLSQLEQQEAATRRSQGGAEPSQLQTQLEASQESESQLRAQLEDSHRRENSLKRRLDDLELELKEAKEALEAETSRPTKKPRIEEPATVQPEVEKPEAEKLEAEQPGAEKPGAEKPGAEKPETDKPDVTEQEAEPEKVEVPDPVEQLENADKMEEDKDVSVAA